MGNPIGEYHYYGNANGWVENSRHFYEYDFRGNKVSELYQIWDNNSLSWKNSYRQVLTYNVYGKLKSTKDSIWNNELSKFEPSWKTIYNYYTHSGSLIVMTYIQEWWNGIYYDFSKTYDTINANGKKMGTLNYLAINGDTLKPWYKLSYSYDFWGNLIEEISFLYADNSGWVNNLRRLYEYAYYLFKDTEKCKNYRRYTREYCKSNDPCSAKKDIRWNNLQLKRNVSRKALPETF